MIKKIIICICVFPLLFWSCDTKKTSIAGKVINATTGEGVYNLLITYTQCQTNGEDCKEQIIGQCYTTLDGSFKIDQKTASKSKKKWITVHQGTKKLIQKDNINLNDKNIVIEVTL
ncbi:MAG: hypothetical protein IT237_05415 [Bacteroidia bacterium]|nr:hypothetical protein [Bacteroidia bacterium]